MILDGNTRYAGFWRRLAAALVDVILLSILVAILLFLVYGPDAGQLATTSTDPVALYMSWYGLITQVLPLILTVFFWVKFLGTPGKLLLGCRIVHADSGAPLGVGRALWRYVSYLFSILPLCLGFAWIGWDKRKQAFHDKLARSVVVIADVSSQSLQELERDLQ